MSGTVDLAVRWSLAYTEWLRASEREARARQRLDSAYETWRRSVHADHEGASS